MMKGRENTMLNQKQIDFVKHAKKLYPNKVELTLAELVRANKEFGHKYEPQWFCLLYTSPSPRDRTRSRMPSSA